MSDISKIQINDDIYDIKDSVARLNNTELVGRLGALAYKNEASGTITPIGSVTAPDIDVTPTTKNVKVVSSVGSLPTWSASVSEEILSFTFDSGTLPTTTNQNVVTGIASASASNPIFNGTSSNITVS